MHHKDLIICKNCGEQFDTDFCPSCGQYRRADFSQKQILKDYLEEAIGIDDKFWITFKTLLFNPGKITLEFIQGKRKKYISPIKFYLLIAFLFFGLQTITESLFPSLMQVSGKINELKDVDDGPDIKFDNFNFQINDNDSLTYKRILEKGDSLGFKSDTKFLTEKRHKLIMALEDGKSKLHFLIFISLPIAALLLKLFYWKTPVSNHLIHMINIYTLIFIYSIIDLFIPFEYAALILYLIFNITLISSFKTVYQRSLIGSILKTQLFIFLLAIAFLVIVLIAIIGYFGFHLLRIS